MSRERWTDGRGGDGTRLFPGSFFFSTKLWERTLKVKSNGAVRFHFQGIHILICSLTWDVILTNPLWATLSATAPVECTPYDHDHLVIQQQSHPIHQRRLAPYPHPYPILFPPSPSGGTQYSGGGRIITLRRRLVRFRATPSVGAIRGMEGIQAVTPTVSGGLDWSSRGMIPRKMCGNEDAS